MSKTIVVSAIAFVAVIAGMIYVINDSRDLDATAEPAVRKTPGAESPVQQGAVQHSSGSQSETFMQPKHATSRTVPTDPRLAALMVSPQSDLIEVVVGDDGRVIKEIDQDPSSLGFKKPMREYTYSGGKVVGLTAYRYFGDHVEITQTAVSYKPDESVDQYIESTSHDYGDQAVSVAR